MDENGDGFRAQAEEEQERHLMLWHSTECEVVLAPYGLANCPMTIR